MVFKREADLKQVADGLALVALSCGYRGGAYPLLFATVSGAHLYGFPSPDSDFDLRGVHLLPLTEVMGLRTGSETVEKAGIHDVLEIDLVTHDARKFFGLLLKKNGYVLEQVFSPLVIHTTPEHAELKEIAGRCVIVVGCHEQAICQRLAV